MLFKLNLLKQNKTPIFLESFFKQLCLRNTIKRLIALWQAVPILLKVNQMGKVRMSKNSTFPGLASPNLLHLTKALGSKPNPNLDIPPTLTNLITRPTDPTGTVSPCQSDSWLHTTSILGFRCSRMQSGQLLSRKSFLLLRGLLRSMPNTFVAT